MYKNFKTPEGATVHDFEQSRMCSIRAWSEIEVQLYVVVSDDIPVRGFIGNLEEGGFLPHTHQISLWAHLHFNIEYNGDHVSRQISYFIIGSQENLNMPIFRRVVIWSSEIWLSCINIWFLCTVTPDAMFGFQHNLS